MMPFVPLALVVLALQTAVDPTPATPVLAATAAAKRTPAVIVIDGKDNDEVWRTAQAIRGFRQFAPVENADPSVETEAKIAYDDRNFYVFVRAFDPHPDSIKSLLARRDNRLCCDQIKLIIDSYHDRRTGFEFAVSPGGVKRDYAVYDDGNIEDDAWDAVWEVGTQVDSLGWTAEFRIPLSQLRYPHKPTNTFGFGIWRDIDRRAGERVSWPVFSTSKRAFISQLGEVVGLDGLTAPTRLELIPYALTKNEPIGYAHTQSATAGGDIKYGNIEYHRRRDDQPRFRPGRAGSVGREPLRVRDIPPGAAPVLCSWHGIYPNVNCNVVNCSGKGCSIHAASATARADHRCRQDHGPAAQRPDDRRARAA